MAKRFTVSVLPKTWILDLDGTIVKHNGYKLDGCDTLLPGVKEFLASIKPEDMVIIVTSRTEEYRQLTLDFLKEQSIRYDHIIFGAPYGERILLNDRKPSGLNMAMALNLDRDKFMDTMFEVDERL